MLTNLKIENLAVIEEAEIDFSDGLNILTGETGAGKSIVIDSINAVLGERTSKEIVRTGKPKAKVTAVFDRLSDEVLDKLEELEIDVEPGEELIIMRSITADGKSTCRINGQPVTVSMLREIGHELIAICGQHDSQKLLQKSSHLAYIDGTADISKELESYRCTFLELKKAQQELDSISTSDAQKQQKLEFLEYQIQEIESADLTIGELQELNIRKKKCLQRDRILSALNESDILISGDEDSDGIVSMLYSLVNKLQSLAEYNPAYEEYCSQVNDLIYTLNDCGDLASRELSDLEYAEDDIDEIEERLDLIYRLSKKYGSDEKAILDYLQKTKNEYENIKFSEERIDLLKSKVETLKADVLKKGRILSDIRKQAAEIFEERVMGELQYLDMSGTRFVVSFEETEPTKNGIDSVEFLISANRGEEEKPLSKIASGGELSRIMLGIRCVLSETETIGTSIFDEIDAGVSGRAATKIGSKLKQVSKSRQVICVTHLAQIAAEANNHLYIEKETTDESTKTKVTSLDYNGRVNEIARIIGGDIITSATLESAKELIEYSAF